MRIDRLSGPFLPRAIGPSGRAPASPAETPPTIARHASGPTGTTAPSHSIVMLLTLAAIPADERRRSDVRRASEGLDHLDRFHGALTGGEDIAPHLDALAEWSRIRVECEDGKLAELMAMIDTRIRVELVKAGR